VGKTSVGTGVPTATTFVLLAISHLANPHSLAIISRKSLLEHKINHGGEWSASMSCKKWIALCCGNFGEFFRFFAFFSYCFFIAFTTYFSFTFMFLREEIIYLE
jgi:hypothetical protein